MSSGYDADFTLESLRELDRFFDDHAANGRAIPGGLLSENLGQRAFALGAYVGDVLRQLLGGEWHADDDSPDGEINLSLELPDGSIVWPVQRVMKRFANGAEDGLYAYGYVLAQS